MSSSGVGRRRPKINQQCLSAEVHSVSSTPATGVEVRLGQRPWCPSHTVAFKLPTTHACSPARNKSNWGLHAVTIVSRPSDGDAGGCSTRLQVCRRLATPVCLNMLYEIFKTQKKIYSRFPAICHNTYHNITPSLYEFQYYPWYTIHISHLGNVTWLNNILYTKFFAV